MTISRCAIYLCDSSGSSSSISHNGSILRTGMRMTDTHTHSRITKNAELMKALRESQKELTKFPIKVETSKNVQMYFQEGRVSSCLQIGMLACVLCTDLISMQSKQFCFCFLFFFLTWKSSLNLVQGRQVPSQSNGDVLLEHFSCPW